VLTEQQPSALRRLAGHVETGKATTSDPAIGRR
jgi:phospholipase C